MKLALVGYARSGKDTVADILQKELKSCKRIAFGDQMKKEFHKENPDISKNPKPREMYEQFANEKRELDPDVWINKLQLPNEKGFKHVIITDLRQPNEAKWAKENGFLLVEVWSPLGLRMKRAESDSDFMMVNPSETHIHDIKCDYIIKNVGTLEELEHKVQSLIAFGKVFEEVQNHEKSSNRRNETSNQHHGNKR